MAERTDRLERLLDWVQRNSEDLLIGTLVALGIVAVMLVLRRIGQGVTSSDPDCRTYADPDARSDSHTPTRSDQPPVCSTCGAPPVTK